MRLMLSTQYAIDLSLNVTAFKDGKAQVASIVLVRLTTLVFSLWMVWQMANRFHFRFTLAASDLSERLAILAKVVAIVVNSVAWGLGL